MAIRLLLDANVPPQLCAPLRARGVEAVSALEWRGGAYASVPDPELLAAAHEEGWTLVSFDLHSIPELLGELIKAGVDHSGVILISSKTFHPQEIGPMAEALARLLAYLQAEDLRNQMLFLPR